MKFFSGFLKYAKNIAYFHHEKWDGSGYPFGLVGREIPLEARIVALADAYESMTSPGTYRKQFSHQQAIHVLLQEAGHHFDPHIVDALVACEDFFGGLSAPDPGKNNLTHISCMQLKSEEGVFFRKGQIVQLHQHG